MQLDWNDSSIQLNPISGDNHIYNLSGTYYPVLTVANAANTGIVQSCTGTVIVTTTPQPGVCGTKYDKRKFYGPGLDEFTVGLCPAGQTVS